MRLLRRTAVVLATLIVSGTLLLDTSAHAVTPEQYGRSAVRATNAVRTAHHLHRLRADACLQRFAASQARRMAAQRRMFHQDIRRPLRACHLSSVGENVAAGFRTGRDVVRNGWMKSPPHRANLLRRSHRLVAVAARKGSDGRWYASQLLGRR
jgi:uncharacterized protein YkwD